MCVSTKSRCDTLGGWTQSLYPMRDCLSKGGRKVKVKSRKFLSHTSTASLSSYTASSTVHSTCPAKNPSAHGTLTSPPFRKPATSPLLFPFLIILTPLPVFVEFVLVETPIRPRPARPGTPLFFRWSLSLVRAAATTVVGIGVGFIDNDHDPNDTSTEVGAVHSAVCCLLG